LADDVCGVVGVPFRVGTQPQHRRQGTRPRTLRRDSTRAPSLDYLRS